MPKGRKKEKKKAEKGMPPSSYITMPHYSHYFPEQVDIIKRMKAEKRRKKKIVHLFSTTTFKHSLVFAAVRNASAARLNGKRWVIKSFAGILPEPTSCKAIPVST